MKQNALIWAGVAITAAGLVSFGYKLLKKPKKKKCTEKRNIEEGEQEQPGVKTTKKKITNVESTDVKKKKVFVDNRNFINKVFDELIENGPMDPEDLNQPSERVPSIIFRQVYDWEQKREKLDILFEIPKGSYLKGIRVFVEESGEEREYPLPGKNMNAGQFIRFLSREYLTNLVKSTLPLYKDKIFVKLEGYYYVSYAKVDPEGKVEKYGYKLIPVNKRRLQESSDAEAYPLSNHLFKVFDAIINEKREFIEDQFVASESNDQYREKNIDDVLFAVRLSLLIADGEHPFGITPAGVNNLIEELLEIVIPGRNTFSYENLIFFDPTCEDNEELAIYAREEKGNRSKLVSYPYNVDAEDE